MRVEIVETTEGAVSLYVEGQLVNMGVGERGELNVYGHDAADGTVTAVLVVAPGEWEHGRWVEPPKPEDVEAYRAYSRAQQQRHGRTERGFL